MSAPVDVEASPIEPSPGVVHTVTPATTTSTAFFGSGTFDDVDPQPGDTVPETFEVTSWDQFQELTTNPGPDLASAVRAFFANQGTDAWVVLTADDSATTLSQELDAWSGPDAPNLVNIVTVPALGSFTGPDYDQVTVALGAAAARTTSFAVLEPPRAVMADVIAADDIAELVALAEHLRTILPQAQQERSALYASSLPADAYDADAPPTASMPVSGAVAGVMATSDTTRGVWKAPAGVTSDLVHIASTPFQPTDAQLGQLNAAGVNPLVTMPDYGVVIWGARTVAGDDLGRSAYKYVSTRRLADFIDSSLHQSMTWAIFEPNAAPLWSLLDVEATAFLNGLYGQGALAGASANEAYAVLADASTTTPQDQADGIVNVEVQFAPVDPAEFVVTTIQLSAGASS